MRKGIERKLKKQRFFANAKDILAFRKRQFDGEDEPENSPFQPRKGYTPEIDQTKTNRQRNQERKVEREQIANVKGATSQW